MSPKERRISLVVADDHPIVLQGVVAVLQAQSDFNVVAVCSDGATAEQAIRKHVPDVAVLDIAMGEVNGLDVLASLKTERLLTRVIFLTATATADQLLYAIELGAHGILLKEMTTNDLIRVVRAVAEGDEWYPPDLLPSAQERQQSRAASVARFANSLTSRERELMLLVAQSLSNKEIARRVNLSEGTVKIHLHNIYQKVGVNNRTALATLTLAHQNDISTDKSS